MRRPEGFNIAFLDIMACGLGAVVLILVLLKNQDGFSASSNNRIIDSTSTLQQEASFLSKDVNRIKEKIAKSNTDSSEILGQISPLTQQLADLKNKTHSETQKLKDLQQVAEDIDQKVQQSDIRNEPVPINATENELEKFDH